MNKLLGTISRGRFSVARIFLAYRNNRFAQLRESELLSLEGVLPRNFKSPTVCIYIYTHIYIYMYSVYIGCAYCAREKVHQPVAHVRHSPWLPEPYRKPEVGRCSRSRRLILGGTKKWRRYRSLRWYRWCVYVRAVAATCRGNLSRVLFLAVDSATVLSPRHTGLHWTQEKHVFGPFLPFLPINTKVLVTYDTWYIPEYSGEVPTLLVPNTVGRGKDAWRTWARGHVFSLFEYTHNGYTAGCCYFMRLSSDHCFFSRKKGTELLNI